MMLQTEGIVAGAVRVLEVELGTHIECEQYVIVCVIVFDGPRILAKLHSEIFW